MEGDHEKVVLLMRTLIDESELFIKSMDAPPTVLPVIVRHCRTSIHLSSSARIAHSFERMNGLISS